MAAASVPEITCTICGTTKPAEEFYFQAKVLKSGARFRINQCIPCRNGLRRAEYVPKPKKDTRKPIPTEKRCSRCHVVKPFSAYARKKGKALDDDGNIRWFPASDCKDCHNGNARIKGPRKPGRVAPPADQPKQCSICKQIKSPDQFLLMKSQRGLPKLRSECTPCRKGRVKAQKAGRIEELRAYNRTYARKYRADNREGILRKARELQRRNKDKVRARRIRDRAANVERHRLKDRAGSHRRRVKERGLSQTGNHKGEYLRAMTAALESYRIGDQYWDVYESRLIDKPTVDHVVAVDHGGTNEFENLVVTSLANNSSKNNAPLLVWMAKRAARYRKDNP